MQATFFVITFSTLAGAAVDIYVMKNGGPRLFPRLAMLSKTLVGLALLHWAIWFRVFDLGTTDWADPHFLAFVLGFGIPVLILAVVVDAVGVTVWVHKRTFG